MIPIACLCIGESATLPGGEAVTRESLFAYRICGIRHTLAAAEAVAAVLADPVLTDASAWEEDVGSGASYYPVRDQKQDGALSGMDLTYPQMHVVACASPSPSPVLGAFPGEGAAAGVRITERMRAGPEADQRVAAPRARHPRAVRVNGKSAAARAARSRREAWIRVSYPAEVER